jgi:hypothetical protein
MVAYLLRHMPSINPQNVELKWVAHLLRIKEALGSNLGHETRYPDLGSPLFLSVTP